MKFVGLYWYICKVEQIHLHGGDRAPRAQLGALTLLFCAFMLQGRTAICRLSEDNYKSIEKSINQKSRAGAHVH